jgi:hypothetical protein
VVRSRILTWDEKATIWELARAGSNWATIAKRLDRHVSSVHKIALLAGGVAPRPLDRRSVGRLTRLSRHGRDGWLLSPHWLAWAFRFEGLTGATVSGADLVSSG